MKKVLIGLYLLAAMLLLLTFVLFPYKQNIIRYHTAEEAMTHSYNVTSNDLHLVFTDDNISFYQIISKTIHLNGTWNFQTYENETTVEKELTNLYVRKDNRGWLAPERIDSSDTFENYTLNTISNEGATVLWVVSQPDYWTDSELKDSIDSKVYAKEVTIDGKQIQNWFIIIKKMPHDYTLKVDNCSFRIIQIGFGRFVTMQNFS